MNTKYPEIGSLVPYLCATPEGKIFDGVGTVQAIFLDPRNRLMVRVKDGQQDFNVDIIGINYTEDTRQAYQDVIDRVTEITVEGNELVKKTVAAYNKQVEDVYSELLGEPVEVAEQPEKEEEAPSLEDVAGGEPTEH